MQPVGAEERDMAVPGFWERSPGLANVHEATYRREFEVPESFADRRVLLRFDAVGDAAEVSVNGQHAGGHVGACLPFEVDITGLVVVPSTTNQLAVFVRDDTHFSVPREAHDRHNRKSWIPRGMGANNRKGIHFYLNGIRCNLRGESPAYAEKAGLFSTRETATEMIHRYQAANCNVLRFHSMPAPPHVLEVCDELGMLVIDESAIYASWQMLMPEHPDWMEHCREHLNRWVRRDRNHPSVILWSAENEGLNVSALTPAMLAEFRRIIDAADASRPVIFEGDGTAYGASPASVKHYVKTIEDLQERGGRSSGYAKDLRNDIYWATAYHQDVPLGCGEFMFPYEPGLREHERDVIYSMGLQARGYRLANWFDIRPYNPSVLGFSSPRRRPPGMSRGL